jgi:hypothetical protein
MNIDSLTIGEIKQIQSLIGTTVDTHPYQIGKNYLIRTVTMIQTGKLVAVTNQELVLEDAAWIASTGRFNECLKDGTFDEVEPFPDKIIVGRGSVIDATEFNHQLPRIVK